MTDPLSTPGPLTAEAAMTRHVSRLGLDVEAALVVSSVYRAANAVRTRATTEVLRPHGLTWTGFVVLWVVWVRGAVESRYAAEAAAISKATLTGVVKTLVAQGLVSRTCPPADRRRVELRLTPSGAGLMEELYPAFNRLESSLVSGLSSRRRREVTDTLREIVVAVESA